MKKPSTQTSSGNRRLSVSRSGRALWKRTRPVSDPEAPVMPPDYWENAVIGKYYRPVRTQVSVRIDNEVLDWLKSKGTGHLTRINQMLRERMMTERTTVAR